MVRRRRRRKPRKRTLYSVYEYTKSCATAKRYFKNRKIKSARIIGCKREGSGTRVYFIKVR